MPPRRSGVRARKPPAAPSTPSAAAQAPGPAPAPTPARAPALAKAQAPATATTRAARAAGRAAKSQRATGPSEADVHYFHILMITGRVADAVAFAGRIRVPAKDARKEPKHGNDANARYNGMDQDHCDADGDGIDDGDDDDADEVRQLALYDPFFGITADELRSANVLSSPASRKNVGSSVPAPDSDSESDSDSDGDFKSEEADFESESPSPARSIHSSMGADSPVVDASKVLEIPSAPVLSSPPRSRTTSGSNPDADADADSDSASPASSPAVHASIDASEGVSANSSGSPSGSSSDRMSDSSAGGSSEASEDESALESADEVVDPASKTATEKTPSTAVTNAEAPPIEEIPAAAVRSAKSAKRASESHLQGPHAAIDPKTPERPKASKRKRASSPNPSPSPSNNASSPALNPQIENEDAEESALETPPPPRSRPRPTPYPRRKQRRALQAAKAAGTPLSTGAGARHSNASDSDSSDDDDDAPALTDVVVGGRPLPAVVVEIRSEGAGSSPSATRRQSAPVPALPKPQSGQSDAGQAPAASPAKRTRRRETIAATISATPAEPHRRVSEADVLRLHTKRSQRGTGLGEGESPVPAVAPAAVHVAESGPSPHVEPVPHNKVVPTGIAGTSDQHTAAAKTSSKRSGTRAAAVPATRATAAPSAAAASTADGPALARTLRSRVSAPAKAASVARDNKTGVETSGQAVDGAGQSKRGKKSVANRKRASTAANGTTTVTGSALGAARVTAITTGSDRDTGIDGDSANASTGPSRQPKRPRISESDVFFFHQTHVAGLAPLHGSADVDAIATNATNGTAAHGNIDTTLNGDAINGPDSPANGPGTSDMGRYSRTSSASVSDILPTSPVSESEFSFLVPSSPVKPMDSVRNVRERTSAREAPAPRWQFASPAGAGESLGTLGTGGTGGARR